MLYAVCAGGTERSDTGNPSNPDRLRSGLPAVSSRIQAYMLHSKYSPSGEMGFDRHTQASAVTATRAF